MSSAIELRKWLNREDHDFAANLEFGNKVWRSMEFVLITKHEIITEEFCRNLPGLRKELKRTGQDPSVPWTTICEFLSLKSSAGAINSHVKEQLVNALRTEANRTLQKNPLPKVLEALLLLLHSQPMQNYYKSSPDAFAGLIGNTLRYLNALLETESKDWIAKQSDAIGTLMNGIRTFVKRTPQMDVFQKGFTAEAFVPFAETVIALKQRRQDVFSEFFAIIQELYFPVNSVPSLKQYLVSAKEESEFAALFGAPAHALVLWLEAILIAFKPDSETQALLHKFLFSRFFSVTQTRFQGSSELLKCVSYYLSILKRHDAQMNTKIGDSKVSSFIGKHVEQLFNIHCESDPANVLDLLCATLRLEPMMLENQLVAISVRCMVLKKDDETSAKLSEFLCLTIDVFRRLSRSEKFVSQILQRLTLQMVETKLSSKMKRKSLAASGTPKKGKPVDAENIDAENESNMNKFFEFLRSDLTVSTPIDQVSDASKYYEWSEISFAWPEAVGQSFTRFMSGLVSKPSITVWKTLIFAMIDCIAILKGGRNDLNTLFLVDVTAAMLCQYFDGSRLTEHAHNMWDLINTNRELTQSLLQEFGTAILSQEHNIRTMNSFLKCCYHLANFEMLCFYYWPDTSVAPESGRNIHGYLENQQWTLIEQRITNFGRNECRANINRLYLQRNRAALLFKPDRSTPIEGLSGTPVLASTLSDCWQMKATLNGESSKVFVSQLSVGEISKLCELVLESDAPLSLLSRAVKDKQFVTILYVTIVKQLADQFGSKKSIFNPVDFDGLLADDVDYASSTKGLVKVVRQFVADAPTVKKCNVEGIIESLALLRKLPVEFVGLERRNFLFALNVMLYVNSKGSGEAELVAEVMSFFKVFLHFGEPPSFFGLFSIEDWINIFGGSNDVLPLYRDVFEKCLKQLNSDNVKMFADLLVLLVSKKDAAGHENVLDVAIILLECLSKFSQEKKCKEQLALYRKAVLARIRRHFKHDSTDDAEKVAFVNRTIVGFNIVVASLLSNAQLASEVDNELQCIFLAYIQHVTIAQHFGASTKLLSLQLTHKTALNISEEHIRATVDRYWSVFLISLKSQEVANDEIVRNSEQFLKTILNHKTQEEFIDLLEAADEGDVDVVDSFTSYKHKLFANIAKCQLNKSKGTLFNEIFKQVSLRILMSIRRRGALLDHLDAVQKLLDCQKSICANIQIPVSVELIDDILAFLGEINIKRVSAGPDPSNTNAILNNPFSNPNGSVKPIATTSVVESGAFEALHSRMSNVCFALIQHRHFFIVDRVTQFVAIMRDLLQSVAWYKSGRKKEAAVLDNGEVTMLAELSHRMENIIKSFVKYAKDVKRLAPYLLIFTIHLMISNEQPTTVFSKIKTHYDSICYDLISVCDHRVEGFIMRNCNEASKQMYEQMIKEYNKYHKFKGKV